MSTLVTNVPDTRTINGKRMNADVTLTPADIGAEQLPFPDVWVPFNDSLRMVAGYGTDTVVNGEAVCTSANFTRASAATYIDKAGVLRTAAINEPRFERAGLLIEGQSTNLLPLNENSPTTSQQSTTNLVQAVTPYGTTGAVTEVTMRDTTPSVPYADYPTLNRTYTGGERVSASVFVKIVEKGTATGFIFECYFSANLTTGINCVYDFDTKNVSFNKGHSSDPVVGVTHLSNGWMRLHITYTASAETRTILRTRYSGTFANFTSAMKYQMCYPQVEDMPFPTSYIPTNGAATTRAADVCSIGSANNFLLGDKTVVAEFNLLGDWEVGAPARRHLYSATLSPTFTAGYLYKTTDNPNLKVGSIEGDSGADVTVNCPNILKGIAAYRRAGSNYTVALLSPTWEATTTTRGIGVALHQTLFIGSQAGGTRFLWGHIHNLRIWLSALTDTQLQGIK